MKQNLDFRKIETQKDLEELFKTTNFTGEDDYFEGMKINSPEEDEEDGTYQFIWVPECTYMGSLMSVDMEDSGNDALFVQTLVQMFKAGKLGVL